MNPILHQWKWDFRHIRLLWIVWIVLLALSVVAISAPGVPGEISQVTATLARMLQMIVVYLFGVLLVARIMFATPFTGTGAFWKTRPLRRRDVFLCKTGFILLMIWLPALVAQGAMYSIFRTGLSFTAWALANFALLTFGMYFLAALWSALCERFTTFTICVATSGAWAAVSALLIQRYSEHSARFPMNFADQRHHAEMVISTTILGMAILAVAAALAWILAGSLNRRRLALAVIAVGIALASGNRSLWLVQFFERDNPQENIITTTVDVLAAEEQPQPGQQLLWQQVVVDIAPQQFVRPTYSALRFEGENGMSTNRSRSGNWYVGPNSSPTGYQALASFYPEGTTLDSGSSRWTREGNLDSAFDNVVGTFEGIVNLEFLEWQKVGSMPLVPGSRTILSSGGRMRLDRNHRSNQPDRLLVSGRIPSPSFRGLERSSAYTFVIYDQITGHIEVADYGSNFRSFGGMFSLEDFRSDLELTKTARRYRREEGLPGHLRLDIYQDVPIGVSGEINFREENWKAYSRRMLRPREETPGKLPAFTEVTLPETPDRDQVKEYLDSLLFSLPNRFRTSQDRTTAEEKFLAIGPANLDLLLASLPVGGYSRELVFRAIRKLATEESLLALLETFRRDPQLAIVFIEKGWQDAAAPTAIEHLKQRIPLGWSTTQQLCMIVCGQRDPATYDDLRWHFTHGSTNHREVLAMLSKCPGFPINEAIREAWQTVRFSQDANMRRRLAGHAARFGDKEALRDAFVAYAESGKDEDLNLLSAAVDHPGGDLLPDWIHRHFESLEFDAAQKRWRLPL